jgi:hypothetical protein
MYFVEAFSYLFNSQNWFGKAFIVFLLTVIPIVNILGAIVLAGYSIRIVREILAGRMEVPEFDFAEDATKGFLLTIAGIVYSIPFLLISRSVEVVQIGQNVSTRMTMSPVVVLLLFILGIIMGMMLLIATVRYAVTDDFAVFVDLGGNFNMLRNNFGAVIMYGLNVIGFGIVGGILVVLGMVLCIIPGIVMAVSLVFGRAYLLAQFAQAIGLSIDDYEEKIKGKPRSSSGTEEPTFRY